MAFPKPDAATKAFFDELVPEDPRVTVRPMFGNFAAFVKGNMFLSAFGDAVAVKLSESDQAQLLAFEGTGAFEPMPGRPMKGYVTLPAAWRDDLDSASEQL